jgi:cytochrome c553
MRTLKQILFGCSFLIAAGASAQTAPAVVTRYCSGCHGLTGISELPYVPRLAGMGAAYLDNKFESYKAAPASPVDEVLGYFRKADRENSLTPAGKAEMAGVARLISDQDTKSAIDWYASRQPAPGKAQNGKVIEQGGRLYANGVESKGVQPCQGCHGMAGEGTDTVPRLAGQHAVYVFRQLSLFRSGARRESPMAEIVRNLETGEARALSNYVQSR